MSQKGENGEQRGRRARSDETASRKGSRLFNESDLRAIAAKLVARRTKCACGNPKCEGCTRKKGKLVVVDGKDTGLMTKAILVAPVKMAKGQIPYIQLPTIAPIHGSAPRPYTPELPDYQYLYQQPESDERSKLEREQQENRRRATAQRNRGTYGFHGSNVELEPKLRYVPGVTVESQDVVDPRRPGRRKATLTAVAAAPRLKAGQQSAQSLYEKPRRRKKKKRKGQRSNA